METESNYSDNFNPEKDAHQLNTIGKKNSFKVPDGYFEELPSKVISRIAEERDRKGGIIISIFQPRIAIAASVLLVGLLVASQTIFNTKQISTPEFATVDEVFEQLTDEDLALLEEDLFLESMMTDAVIEGDIPFEDLNDEDAIINYLIQNNVDISTIANDL